MAGRANRQLARKARHTRLRTKLRGTAARPRLSVYRSLQHIYAQVIDDDQGHTLATASTLDPEIRAQAQGRQKHDIAALVGISIAKRAREKGVTTIAFDRGGCKYHGRVKALAEAARQEGLEF
jgi:large subunit ribosomal protein L18